MPEFQITYRRPNEPIDSVEQDDTTLTTIVRASTPKIAVRKALELAISPNEIEGFGDPEVVELDEDGNPA